MKHKLQPSSADLDNAMSDVQCLIYLMVGSFSGDSHDQDLKFSHKEQSFTSSPNWVSMILRQLEKEIGIWIPRDELREGVF